MDDYFSVEPSIIARLQEQIQNVKIKSSMGMPKIHESLDLAPAVLVDLEDDRPGQAIGYGTDQRVEQIWACIVVVKNARSEAGPLISKVINAMNGWRPEDTTFSFFKRVKSNFSPDYSPNGVYYFPLAFSTSFIFNS